MVLSMLCLTLSWLGKQVIEQNVVVVFFKKTHAELSR
jgi:hypothetical protein